MVCAASAASRLITWSLPCSVPDRVVRVIAVWMLSRGVGGLTDPSLWNDTQTPASTASPNRIHSEPISVGNSSPSSRSPQ